MKKENLKIYFYDFKTKEYIGSKDAFDSFGNEIKHANTTEIAPIIKEGFASVFSKETQIWTNIEDHRGKEGFVGTESIKIKELGELPANFTLEPVEPAKTDDELREDIKSQRDILLKESDFAVAIDAPFSDEEKKVWLDYRKALRDLPQQEIFLSNPEEFVFPEKP